MLKLVSCRILQFIPIIFRKLCSFTDVSIYLPYLLIIQIFLRKVPIVIECTLDRMENVCKLGKGIHKKKLSLRTPI